jgi:hypothetical protein
LKVLGVEEKNEISEVICSRQRSMIIPCKILSEKLKERDQLAKLSVDGRAL